jgi:hypothetical protein
MNATGCLTLRNELIWDLYIQCFKIREILAFNNNFGFMFFKGIFLNLKIRVGDV